jgi:hypothetical protein
MIHHCTGDTPHAACGMAIHECFENEKGELWVSNTEYSSQVNYCPFCGYKADTSVEDSLRHKKLEEEYLKKPDY